MFDVPVELTRFHGSYSYGRGWHPFLAALGRGPEALAEFYDRFQPRTISDFYFLDAPIDGPVWMLPWLPWWKHRPPSGEAGLGIDHGVSYFGPCSVAKVNLEYRRLTEITESIRRNGYHPDRPIRGFLMRREGELRFFVRGGKHRAAALAFLGARSLPVKLISGWPLVVDRTDASRWPLVQDGRLTKEVAERIFDRYFDFDGSQQARRLGIDS
jgi:hypothetical protein